MSADPAAAVLDADHARTTTPSPARRAISASVQSEFAKDRLAVGAE